MRKLMFLSLFFLFIAVNKNAYCQDNLLAVDVIDHKQKSQGKIDKVVQEDNANKAIQPLVEEAKPNDDSEGGLEKIKAYHELFDSKQKELEIIKLDLEKSSLLLKKKEAEKEIFEIDKSLPQGKTEVSSLSGSSIQGAKDSLVDASDIKIQLLLIADGLKEGQASLKGAPYSFKEGDTIASKLTAQEIESSGITFKQTDGSIFKINFIN